MKRTEKITAASVMTFIIAFSAVTLFRGNLEIMNTAKKNLIDGGFSEELINCMAENFPMKDKWRAIGAELNSKFGEPIVNGVYIDDERLFSLDLASYEDMDSAAEFVNEFTEKYDGAVYFAAIPTSTGVYGDVLPSYLLPITEKQQADRLYEELSPDIRKIDAYTILKMLSDNNYIYCRSDTRWTSYGAYCVYRTVIQKLGFIPVSYDKYTIFHVTDSYCGNLYSRTSYMESKPDILDIYEYDDGTVIEECTGIDKDGVKRRITPYDESNIGYELYLGEPMPFVKIRTSVNNDKKLLVIGDTSSDSFIPFLTKHYSEIAFVSVQCTGRDIEKYIDPDNYEQTLFLLGLDSIANIF